MKKVEPASHKKSALIGNGNHFYSLWCDSARDLTPNLSVSVRTLSSHQQRSGGQLPLVSLQVIAPEEIVDPNVDEHSVMTYLSQFPKSKLKPGAPLRAKTLHPKRAKAFGPGG